MAKKDGAPDEIALEAGRRIKSAREGRGWTQKQLAEASGFNEDRARQPAMALKPSALGNYEQGTRRVGWEEASALSELFGDYPPAYYMGIITEDEARVLQALPGRHHKPRVPFTESRQPEKRRKNATS